MSGEFMVSIERVQCEYQSNPICIGTRKPAFSYCIASCEYGILQQARRICISSCEKLLLNDDFDLYDSGWEECPDTYGLVYQGKMLYSRQLAVYFIFSRLGDGRILKSELCRFEVGLLYQEDFKARFIRYQMPVTKTMRPGTFDEGMPSPLMRTEFFILNDRKITKARIYATTLGSYRLRINGVPASEDVLAPGWTVFDRMQPYQCYDATPFLQPGENAVGAILGDGWYTGSIGLFGREFYGSYPLAFFCQVEIEFEDGTKQQVYTDDTWRAVEGPVRYSDFFSGEYYDARMEKDGWDCAGYDDSAWDKVNDCWYGASPARGEMRPQLSPPMRIQEHVKPASVMKVGVQAYRFDMGQNMVGWQCFKISGTESGQKITFVFAEAVKEDGSLYRENLRRARNTDYYICKGRNDEVFEPLFTYRGFRYVDVYGLISEPKADDLTGCVVHSSFERTGSFTCSDELINRLYLNTVWSQRGNMLDVPTDCPQRDERWGCITDAMVFSKSACYHMDMSRFYMKYSSDIFFSQWDSGEFAGLIPRMSALGVFAKPGEILTADKHSTGYCGLDGGVVFPHRLLQYYHNTEFVRRYFHDMERYMDFIREFDGDYSFGGDGAGDPEVIYIEGFGYVPHTAGGYDIMHIEDPTPGRVIDTAYYALTAEMMSEMAYAIGRTDRAEYYRALREKIAEAFNRHCVCQISGRVQGYSQTAYSIALNLNLLCGEVREKAAARLAEKIADRGDRLSTGCMGNGHLLPALCDNGYAEKAYSVLLQKEYPSWLYQVLRGATTMWERWDGYTDEKGFSAWAHDRSQPINSLNHYFLGCVAEWFYEYMGGIKPGEGADSWKNFKIRPFTDSRINSCSVSYRTIYGEIKSGWEYQTDGILYTAELPANTGGVIELYDTGGRIKILQGEGHLRELPTEGRRKRFSAVSGCYKIKVNNK